MANLEIGKLNLAALSSTRANASENESSRQQLLDTLASKLTQSAKTKANEEDDYTQIELKDEKISIQNTAKSDIESLIKPVKTPISEEDETDEIARKVDTDNVSKEQAAYLEDYIKSAIDATGIKITENKKEGKTQTIKAENDNGDKVKVTVKYDDEGRITSIDVVTTKTEGDTETKTTKGIDIKYEKDGDMVTSDKNPKPTAKTEAKIDELMETLDCTRDEAIDILKEKDLYETDDNKTKVKEDGTIYKKNEDGEWEKAIPLLETPIHKVNQQTLQSYKNRIYLRDK